MSDRAAPNKKARKVKTPTIKKGGQLSKVVKTSEPDTLHQPIAVIPEYPKNQEAIPIPVADQKTIDNVEKLIELSYVGYLKELRVRDYKDDEQSMTHLNGILSEYLGPYMIIGFMPDNEPIEIMSAPSPMAKEALLERLRKTFFRHMNVNSPG